MVFIEINGIKTILHRLLCYIYEKLNLMAKSQDAKKTAKKEPLKTAKEKKEDKRIKKNTPKRD